MRVAVVKALGSSRQRDATIVIQGPVEVGIAYLDERLIDRVGYLPISEIDVRRCCNLDLLKELANVDNRKVSIEVLFDCGFKGSECSRDSVCFRNRFVDLKVIIKLNAMFLVVELEINRDAATRAGAGFSRIVRFRLPVENFGFNQVPCL